MSKEEELLLNHWRELTAEQQQQVLGFMQSFGAQTQSLPRSPLGQRLRELRAKIVASGLPLLNDDELDQEIAERRGGIET